jgi:hypothetical protein
LTQTGVSATGWQAGSQALGTPGTAAIDVFWTDLANLEVVQSDAFTRSDTLA